MKIERKASRTQINIISKSGDFIDLSISLAFFSSLSRCCTVCFGVFAGQVQEPAEVGSDTPINIGSNCEPHRRERDNRDSCVVLDT